MRQTTADDLLLLAGSAFIGTLADPNNPGSINGVAVPLGDQWVLTPEEQLAIRTATDAYNTTIATVAGSNSNIALVDFKGVLTEASSGIQFDAYTMTTKLVTGGLVSLDGVHLTSRGYALMANKILAAMDIEFGSNFTLATNGLAKAGDYPTNYSAILR
jgi:lysophospholipase L1-like esterase